MPLIPKPPSFELALAEMKLREQISGANIIQDDVLETNARSQIHILNVMSV